MVAMVEPDPLNPDAMQPSLATSIWRHVRRPLVEAVVIYLFFAITAHTAVVANARGQLYDLRPHGPGALLEAFIIIVMITAFHLVYCLPALFVRRWLGLILRMLMYGLFVLFLTWLHWEKFVAVRLTADQVILVRHYPRSPIEIPRARLPQPVVHDTGTVRVLQVWYGAGEPYVSVPVYHPDVRTTATLADIARQLNARVRVSDDTANH